MRESNREKDFLGKNISRVGNMWKQIVKSWKKMLQVQTFKCKEVTVLSKSFPWDNVNMDRPILHGLNNHLKRE